MKGRAATYVKNHHLALLCLFLIIGGGTAWAAGLAPNSVKSKTIKDGQVKAADIGSDTVTGDELKGVSDLNAEFVLLNDDVVDGAPEVGDPIKVGEFSLIPSCRQSPAGTFTAAIVIQADIGPMAVHSTAENGVSNPSVVPGGVATLIQVGPTTGANIRSGAFGAFTDNGASLQSITGNVVASTKAIDSKCLFSVSATGQ